MAGISRLHAMVGRHAGDAEDLQVVVGIETDRGMWVQALVAAGYQVYPVNPLQAARFRERLGVSGAKSDPVTPTPSLMWSAQSATSCARSPATATAPRR